MSYSESRRRIVHMGMGGFALLLRVPDWRGAALCAVAAFLFNLLVAWVRPAIEPRPSWLFVSAAPIAGAAVAGLVESMPVRLEDNLSVPASAAAAAWELSLVTPAAWSVSAPHVWRALPLAVVLNGAAAAAGWWVATISAGGWSPGRSSRAASVRRWSRRASSATTC